MTGYVTRRGARTGVLLWRSSSTGPEHQIVPDGVMDLMWFQGRLVVAGADTRSITIPARTGESTWGLQLAPGVAHALLGVSADQLTDQRIDLSEFVKLTGAAAGSYEDDDVSAALERVFVALWARSDPDLTALRLASSLDRSARDGLSVKEMAVRHDLPERSLRRVSDTLFGYGPKTLMQIHRFQRALHLARAGKSLSDAATTAGYSDQAHFSREARRFADSKASELVSR